MEHSSGHTLTPMGYELVANCFRVLSEPVRLRLLHQLRSGEKNVGELVSALQISQPSVSKHLKVLLEAEYVARRQEGTSAFFSIKEPMILQLCDLVCGSVEQQLAERIQAGQRSRQSAIRGR
ncbi:MAG: ArsR/SmtB family transcription factor [Myxococcota bacterium]